MVRFMTLGDPHFKHNEFYLQRVVEMGEHFIELCRRVKPDFIVNLGDTLHDHRRLDMVAQVKAVQFMRKLKEIAPLYVLIGNHDRINNSEFFTNITPFEAMKDWNNTVIVDDCIHKENIKGELFYFCPYLPPGKLKEGFDMFDLDPNDYVCGFSHQEFKGAKMGAIVSEAGDEWEWERPMIAGHVHNQHRPSPYINYVGTPLGHSHGDNGRKTVSLFTTSREGIEDKESHLWCKSGEYFVYEERFDLPVPKLKTVYMDASKFLEIKFEDGVDPRYFRIIVTGKDADVKIAKKSDTYKELENLGCKIHFPISDSSLEGEEREEGKGEGERRFVSYEAELVEVLKKDKELYETYLKIISS